MGSNFPTGSRGWGRGREQGSAHMVGCIINRYPENNAVRKFERGGGQKEKRRI